MTIIITDEVASGVVGIVDGALEEVLVETSYVVVDLDLTVQIVSVESERTHVLVDVLDRLQRLHHSCSFVQHLLPHRHWLPRRYRFSSCRHRRCQRATRSHLSFSLSLSPSETAS